MDIKPFFQIEQRAMLEREQAKAAAEEEARRAAEERARSQIKLAPWAKPQNNKDG